MTPAKTILNFFTPKSPNVTDGAGRGGGDGGGSGSSQRQSQPSQGSQKRESLSSAQSALTGEELEGSWSKSLPHSESLSAKTFEQLDLAEVEKNTHTPQESSASTSHLHTYQ
jgi:hypothetical protein